MSKWNPDKALEDAGVFCSCEPMSNEKHHPSCTMVNVLAALGAAYRTGRREGNTQGFNEGVDGCINEIKSLVVRELPPAENRTEAAKSAVFRLEQAIQIIRQLKKQEG